MFYIPEDLEFNDKSMIDPQGVQYFPYAFVATNPFDINFMTNVVF